MINRYPLLACALVVLLVGYLCFAIPAAGRLARADRFAGCRIAVADSARTGFVTSAELAQECDGITSHITELTRGQVNLNDLESRLRASDKIERVNVAVLNNGALAIDVVPMVPVARVFDSHGSYYINAEGKRISADPRYHVDVPVVVGRFTEKYPAKRLLPMLSYIASRPELDALVSTLKQDSRGDIILVPSIRGHVVNFGDTSMVADKFERLRTFYRKVMPVRGWETYDTLSVKWRGQIVATHRVKALAPTAVASSVEEFDEADDLGTILTPLHTSAAPLPENPDTI